MSPLLSDLNETASKKNIPLETYWELTYRCNLACEHCYVANESKEEARELSLEEITRTLDGLAAAGGLFVTFTGGEPMLRRDLFDIIAAARERSFAVSMFSNGTLIGADAARELHRLGVSETGISIYGATAAVHDSIMRVPGVFDRAIAGIEALKAAGVRVAMKSVILRQNFADFEGILALAEKLGVRSVADSVVTPRNDGAADTLEFHLAPEQLAEVYGHPYFSERAWQGPWERGPSPVCDAGRNSVAITPYGDVLPCLQFIVSMGNLREKAFAEIWADKGKYLDYMDIKEDELGECAKCGLRNFCGRCPGLALLERNSATAPCRSACLSAEARKILYEKRRG